MNTFIALEKLADTDLNDFHEVWLTTEETYPQDPALERSLCLWRADRVLTQDIAIDEAYFQDLPCLWLLVDDLHNKASVQVVENALKARLAEEKLSGKFYPAPKPQAEEEPSDARDLRS
jgi:hypothetical protein